MSTSNRSATLSPMDDNLLRVFQREIANNCTFLVVAANGLQSYGEFIYDNQRDPRRSAMMTRFWMTAQTIVVAAANISKALWGTWDAQVERETLRTSLDVDDSSPLKLRSMRNHYEHFDRRLEEWHVAPRPADTPRFHIDMFIGNLTGKEFRPPPLPIEIFRGFNPETFELTFWGETFNVNDVAGESVRILVNCDAQLNPPGRTPEELLLDMSGMGQ